MNHHLLNKFFTNECNTFERKIVIDWVLEPANDFLLKQWMKDNWDKLGVYDTESELDIDKVWMKLQTQLQFEAQNPTQEHEKSYENDKMKFSSYRKMIIRITAVASFLIILSSSIIWLQNKRSSTDTETNKSIITHINNENTTQKIVLEDGTKVFLSAKATLSYPKSFLLNKREVTLEGDAFFDVEKDASKPFLVYTSKIITKVLGTSFSIQSSKSSNDIIVSVVTGKVQVFEKNEKNLNAINSKTLSNEGILLTPNQKVIYTADKQNFETSIVEKPVPINNALLSKNYFDFNRSYLPDVVIKLQKVYGIEVILENDNFNKCIFSGDITEESLYEKLDLICKSIGASYELSGTRILITGKGCKY